VAAGVVAWGLSLLEDRVALVSLALLSTSQLLEAVAAGRRRALAREKSAGFRPTNRPTGSSPEALQPGPVVLEGEVSYATEANHAMFVEFIQEGAESESSGTWSYRWTERARRLTIAPFYLESASGRVRVEPEPGRAQLADSLEGKILVPTAEELRHVTPIDARAPLRKRIATLVPGERVWVVGALARGYDPEANAGGPPANSRSYRENAPPEGLVLRGDPSLLVSSIPLEKHFAARARMHGRDRFAYALFALAPFAILARYVDRALGVPVTGRVTQVIDLSDDDGAVTGHRLTVDTPIRTVVTEVGASVDARVGNTVTLRLGRESHNAGPTAAFTPHEAGLLLAGWFCFTLIALLLRARGRVLPWYRSEKALLVDTGTGRLADSIQEKRV
jgi:hypothetical protein